MIVISYILPFEYIDIEGAGFSFDCDKNGIVNKEKLNHEALINYEACLTGSVRGKPVKEKDVQELRIKIKECLCGSGKESFELNDARGIFCCYVCDDCEKEKRSQYRVEVLEDPNYTANEPIEPE